MPCTCRDILFSPGRTGLFTRSTTILVAHGWFSGAAQIEVQDFKRENQKSPEERAIELAKGFDNYPGSSLDADFLIRKHLEGWHGELKIEGWKAQRINDNVYIASYEFQGSNTKRGWYYEVNLAGGIVRDIAGDDELERRYSISGAIPWIGGSFLVLGKIQGARPLVIGKYVPPPKKKN